MLKRHIAEEPVNTSKEHTVASRRRRRR